MGQKRTPALVTKAKRLRAEGRSYVEIAEELSKQGKSISKASVIAWLRDASGPTAPPSATSSGPSERLEAPVPTPAAPAQEPERPVDIPPDELRAILADVVRRASRAAAVAEAAGQPVEAARERKIMAVFTGQLQRIHARADEDTETVRVKATDMAAAADRAWSGLEQQAAAVLAEVDKWERCSGCGERHGEFAPGADRSRARALFERVAKRKL